MSYNNHTHEHRLKLLLLLIFPYFEQLQNQATSLKSYRYLQA